MMGGGMVSCWIQPAGSTAKMGITPENFGLVGVNEWALHIWWERPLKANVLLNRPTWFSLTVHYKHVVTCTDQFKFAKYNLNIYLLYCVDSWKNMASLEHLTL